MEGQPQAPGLPWRMSSSFVMGITGFLSRAFLLGPNHLEVNGMDEFLKLLDERQEVDKRQRGLITVSNHISVIDDPLMFGALPFRYHWSPNNLRWALASHDLAFKYSALSYFFAFGQTLPTHRIAHSKYGGPFQPTITQAVRLLSSHPFTHPASKDLASHKLQDPFTEGQLTYYTTNGNDAVPVPAAYTCRRHAWIHIFPEGKIYQTSTKTMRYFKWGVSRLILESDPCPDLVPVWLEGIDHVMHESRKFPRFVPRGGKSVSITFGERVDVDAAFGDLRDRWQKLVQDEAATSSNKPSQLGDLPERLQTEEEAVKLREECTMRVREEVLKLRRKRGWPEESPETRLVETWKGDGVKRGVREGEMEDGSWVKDT